MEQIENDWGVASIKENLWLPEALLICSVS